MLMEGGAHSALCDIGRNLLPSQRCACVFPNIAANGNCLRMFHLGKTDDFSNLSSSNVGLTRFQHGDTARTPASVSFQDRISTRNLSKVLLV